MRPMDDAGAPSAADGSPWPCGPLCYATLVCRACLTAHEDAVPSGVPGPSAPRSPRPRWTGSSDKAAYMGGGRPGSRPRSRPRSRPGSREGAARRGTACRGSSGISSSWASSAATSVPSSSRSRPPAAPPSPGGPPHPARAPRSRLRGWSKVCRPKCRPRILRLAACGPAGAPGAGPSSARAPRRGGRASRARLRGAPPVYEVSRLRASARAGVEQLDQSPPRAPATPSVAARATLYVSVLDAVAHTMAIVVLSRAPGRRWLPWTAPRAAQRSTGATSVMCVLRGLSHQIYR